jgi:hypothetical protein
MWKKLLNPPNSINIQRQSTTDHGMKRHMRHVHYSHPAPNQLQDEENIPSQDS